MKVEVVDGFESDEGKQLDWSQHLGQDKHVEMVFLPIRFPDKKLLSRVWSQSSHLGESYS